MDPKGTQHSSSQTRGEHQAENKQQQATSQRKMPCLCAECKGLKLQKAGMRELHMHQWGPMVLSVSAEGSGDSMLNVSRSLDIPTTPATQPASNRNLRKNNTKSSPLTGTSHTPVTERDYTISLPKLLELQATHGVSDATIDDILSTLHNKLLHPGNTCPGSLREARKLILKSSSPSKDRA